VVTICHLLNEVATIIIKGESIPKSKLLHIMLQEELFQKLKGKKVTEKESNLLNLTDLFYVLV